LVIQKDIAIDSPEIETIINLKEAGFDPTDDKD
jgi:hypothetical protein